MKYHRDEMVAVQNEPGLGVKLVCAGIEYEKVSTETLMVQPMYSEPMRYNRCGECDCQWYVVWADSLEDHSFQIDGCLNPECENVIDLTYYKAAMSDGRTSEATHKRLLESRRTE